MEAEMSAEIIKQNKGKKEQDDLTQLLQYTSEKPCDLTSQGSYF